MIQPGSLVPFKITFKLEGIPIAAMAGKPSVSPIQMQLFLSEDGILSVDDLNLQYQMPNCGQDIMEKGIQTSMSYTITDEKGKFKILDLIGIICENMYNSLP